MTNADEAAPAGLLGTKYSQALRLWRGGVRLYRASEDGGDWYERRPRPRTSRLPEEEQVRHCGGAARLR